VIVREIVDVDVDVDVDVIRDKSARMWGCARSKDRGDLNGLPGEDD